MAIKSTLFMLAFVLLVTRMGSSAEVENYPPKAPVHAPSTAPVHAPQKAPVYYPPASPPHGCVAMCAAYCKPIHPKRPCMRACGRCCDDCKCVPGFMKCSNWTQVKWHNRTINCP